MNDRARESLNRFREYRSIVPDYERFEDNLRGRRSAALRTNRWKNDAESLLQRLVGEGRSVRRDPRLTNLLRWRDNRPASATLSHWTGRYYLQDPASLIPVEALDVGRGSVVLDMCAAPGGKAFHLSERVEESGLVVANEPNPDRRITLASNAQRMGPPNLAISGYDGQSVPERIRFDAVLVDAPCSGEGTARKDERPPGREPADRLDVLAETQVRILTKACRVVKPGGVVVYSTCSFAPEENEAVVSRVLEDSGMELETIPLEVPHEPGVESWKGDSYSPEVRNMWRCYPRHLSGGGMTVARLRRKGNGRSSGRDRLTGTDRITRVHDEEAVRFVRSMEEQFGVDPGIWTAGRLTARSGSIFWGPRSGWEGEPWDLDEIGWRVGRSNRGGFKPTTRALQRLGSSVRYRRVRCRRKGLKELLRERETRTVEVPGGMERGYVAVEGPARQVLGCGFWTGDCLRSQLPKGLTNHFPEECLEK